MAVSWPVSVPFRLRRTTWNAAPQPNFRVTPVAAGPKPKRRISSAVGETVVFVNPLYRAQFLTFETWYREDLMDGVLDFDAVHPITGAMRSWSFDGDQQQPYSVADRGPGRLDLTLRLVLLP